MLQPSEREIEVFNAALELSSAERVAYLDQVCADNAALRHRVEELLKASGKAGGFLQSADAVPPASGGTVRLADFPTGKPGDRIGRYKLLQQIGEGGCGVVYMAEQEEPVRRRVALKVIKLGMDTKDVIARFEAERQALALMDHPNIAKVLDAGATETGRPYFVMELVRGTKITDYCDHNNLSARERLGLFVQICHAIDHAHQKGIIHRDIKPSNILVTLRDGVPAPKVIDFGIAKATNDQRLTDKTLFTAFEQFIGTPAYMSPEQAEMNEFGIDARSDIYSLGVLFYELLTGQTPFDSQELMRAGLIEIRRIIREQEPMKPSTRLNTMKAANLTEVAKQRQMEPSKLTHFVRGELDWIVMKALEKDRSRRYESANGLAQDVERYLADEPVLARPTSAFYRFRKLARRNKTVFAMSGATVVAAVLALVVGMRIARRPVITAMPPSKVAALKVERAPVVTLGFVSGIVLAKDTGKPIAHAEVRVASPSADMRMNRQNPNSPDIYHGQTGADGRFKIPAPQKGTVAVDVFAPGYESAAGTYMSGSRMKLESLPFAAGQNQDLTITLEPALYVAGVVQDEAGQPLAGVHLTATLISPGSLGYVAFALSDTNGHFEIFDFWTSRWKNNSAQGRVEFTDPSMLRALVQDVYSLSQEQRKNLRVTLKRGHDLRGQIASAGGKPVQGMEVQAVPSGDGQEKDGTTDAEGRFLIRGLPDGDVTIRAHSLALEQKVEVKMNMAGADLETNLRFAPVTLKNIPESVRLLGMKLTDMTPELKAVYDQDLATGVLILDPGENAQRLGIGDLREGYCFWMVGNKAVKNLREMVAELLRLSAINPPLIRGWNTEGYRGSIRVVYIYPGRHGTNTQYIQLTDEDLAELKKLAAVLEENAAKK